MGSSKFSFFVHRFGAHFARETHRAVFGILATGLLLTGCVNFETAKVPEPQPVSDPSAYKPVEFVKIASGGFAGELEGKLVSLRCKFLQAYSLDGSRMMAQVAAVEPNVLGGVGISFHDHLKEKVVTLKMGDVIVVRGKVRTASNVYATGSFIEVYFLDKE